MLLCCIWMSCLVIIVTLVSHMILIQPEMNSSDKEREEEVESPTQGKNLLTNLQSKPTLVSDENAEKCYLNSVQDVPRQPKITQDDSSSSQVDFDSYDTTLPAYNKIL